MRKRKIQPPGWFMLFAWNHSRRMIDYARMMHETCIWHAHKPCSMHDSWCSHQIRLTNDSCCVHDSSCLNEVMVQSCPLCVHNSWLWHDLHDNVFMLGKYLIFFDGHMKSWQAHDSLRRHVCEVLSSEIAAALKGSKECMYALVCAEFIHSFTFF